MLCFIELTALKLLQVSPLSCGVWTGSQDKRFLLRAVQLHALTLVWVSHRHLALTQTKRSTWLVSFKRCLVQRPGCPHVPKMRSPRGRNWRPACGRRHRSITESRWLPPLTLESLPLKRYHMCARQRGRRRALRHPSLCPKVLAPAAELLQQKWNKSSAAAWKDSASLQASWKKVEAESGAFSWREPGGDELTWFLQSSSAAAGEAPSFCRTYSCPSSHQA